MSFNELECQMKNIISNLKPETEFLLRDIIANPPALLGRKLNEGVKDGTIPDVEFIGIIDGYDKYRKL